MVIILFKKTEKDAEESQNIVINILLSLGSGCGAVGRVVASATGGSQFESIL